MQSVQNITTNEQPSALLSSASIGVSSARDELPRMVDEVQYLSTTYVIKKNGKPAAALVPINILEQWQAARTARFAVIDRIQQQTAKLNLNEEEVNQLINDAISEARRGDTESLVK